MPMPDIGAHEGGKEKVFLVCKRKSDYLEINFSHEILIRIVSITN
mgnify:CR=1 FL=1